MKKPDSLKATYYIAGILFILLLLFFSYSRVFDEFEQSTLDFRYSIRPPQEVDEEIVIIEVGDDSIEKIGKWPFTRNYHALLVKALKSAGVETIIFDIFFSEGKEGDESFAEAVKEAGNVYMPYIFELDRSSRDDTRTYATGYAASLIDVLEESAVGTGFINVEPDIDGKIRRIPPFIEYDGKMYPHLTVLAAINRLGREFDDIEVVFNRQFIVNKDLIIPLGRSSSMMVNYPAVWGKAFRHYSYVDVLQSYLADVTGQEPVIDLKELDGTICFVGMTATASPDAHPSPMEPLYPGIGVHTSVYNSIIKGHFLVRLNKWWNLVILLFMWILTAYVTEKIGKRFAHMSILLIMAAYVLAAVFAFVVLGIWIDVFYPLITVATIYVIFTFTKYIKEMQKRELIEKELNIAKDIQRSFLPIEIPDVGGLDINVQMLTARQVGGDLYDIVDLGEGKLGVMLGDVSGKGVPAALYMARVVSVFKTYVKGSTADKVLENVNNRLVRVGTSNLFVTVTYMIFDTNTKTISFSIGGHLPTIMIKPDGEVELLDVKEGLPLGMIEGEFSLVEREYEKGSIFLLYSDGVTEAMNTREEMFEEDRLVALSAKMQGKSPEEIVNRIHKAVLDFAGRAKQHDDITVMAICT